MTRYSFQPRDYLFLKDYGFLSVAKNMGKNIGRNNSKSLSSKHSQKVLDDAKQLATDALETASKNQKEQLKKKKKKDRSNWWFD